MMNLQIAKERVNQIETVWMKFEKWLWKSMKYPQPSENWK